MPAVISNPPRDRKGRRAVEPLAASTTMIPTMTTVCGMTPTAASMALSNAANGPIQDIIGNNGLVLNHFKEAAKLVSYLQRVTDAADPNLALLNGVYNSLIGSGSPTSTNLLQSMNTILANGATALTLANCNAAAGPITDYIGNCNGVNIMFKEANRILVLVYRDIDAADPMKSPITDILLTLASTGTLMAFLEWLDDQGGIPDVPPVTIDPTSQTFLVSGGTGEFSVTITGLGASQSWTVDKDGEATWLQLVSPPLHEPVTEDGVVRYNVSANASGALRTAHFYVNGKTYTVNQSI